MSGPVLNNVVLHDEALTRGPDLKHELDDEAHATEVPQYYEGTGPMQTEYVGYDFNISDHDLQTLTRVPAKINWTAYTVAFVELAERFSFYGTTVVYTNYIKNPLLRPTGKAPVGEDPDQVAIVAGALGMGAQTAAVTASPTF